MFVKRVTSNNENEDFILIITIEAFLIIFITVITLNIGFYKRRLNLIFTINFWYNRFNTTIVTSIS